MFRLALAIVLSILAPPMWAVAEPANAVADSPERLVTLAVRDERPSTLVGTRGADIRLGDITVGVELEKVVETALVETFGKAGFRVQISNPSQASLVVDVRHLSFEEHAGIWSGKSIAQAAISARVVKGGVVAFERLYRGSSEKRGVFVGSSSSSRKLVDVALSRALENVAADPELVAALTAAIGE